LTKEQVARALNAVCDLWLRRRRGADDIAHVAEVICYHQRRNAAAMRSRGKPGDSIAL